MEFVEPKHAKQESKFSWDKPKEEEVQVFSYDPPEEEYWKAENMKLKIRSDGQETALSALEKENARLRRMLSRYEETIADLQADNKQLKADITELAIMAVRGKHV